MYRRHLGPGSLALTTPEQPMGFILRGGLYVVFTRYNATYPDANLLGQVYYPSLQLEASTVADPGMLWESTGLTALTVGPLWTMEPWARFAEDILGKQ
ncbi:hypothetical protein QFC20_003678 [Naganishia adeliensis]|uniref:Uncharacterized protein n=1 Tax=Naganishia adeliensis TaxID=92952 RepID=A0ACC2W8M8_9TREE|nr:hypothetical protein QFC20_003678 [Naganishia adeliensis]